MERAGTAGGQNAGRAVFGDATGDPVLRPEVEPGLAQVGPPRLVGATVNGNFKAVLLQAVRAVDLCVDGGVRPADAEGDAGVMRLKDRTGGAPGLDMDVVEGEADARGGQTTTSISFCSPTPNTRL